MNELLLTEPQLLTLIAWLLFNIIVVIALPYNDTIEIVEEVEEEPEPLPRPTPWIGGSFLR